jgi:hypothetical protein
MDDQPANHLRVEFVMIPHITASATGYSHALSMAVNISDANMLMRALSTCCRCHTGFLGLGCLTQCDIDMCAQASMLLSAIATSTRPRPCPLNMLAIPCAAVDAS